MLSDLPEIQVGVAYKTPDGRRLTASVPADLDVLEQVRLLGNLGGVEPPELIGQARGSWEAAWQGWYGRFKSEVFLQPGLDWGAMRVVVHVWQVCLMPLRNCSS